MDPWDDFFDKFVVLHPAQIQVLINRQDNMVPIEEGQPIRNINYFEHIIPSYSLSEYRNHFRMTRETMNIIIQEKGNRFQGDRQTVPLEKKILFTVWMLAKPETYSACCARFDFSKSTGHFIFYEICQILVDMMPIEIKWPTNEELVSISDNIQITTTFPNVVGAIDGCHIPIKAPKNNPIDFYNRKSFHSIILQAICDHKLMFRDIFIGMPGRVHDARVFRNSPISQRLDAQLIPEEYHILGDSAYPLHNYLLVPFRDNSYLTRAQTNFNYKLSCARSKIEQAFGRLKGKFRRLKYLDMDVENVPTVIAASCVLHNMIIKYESELEDNFHVEHLDGDINNGNFNGEEMGIAVEKRLKIMNELL